MKVAIVGSRTLTVDNVDFYLPKEVDTIISGGAKGIDLCAEQFAKEHRLPFHLFLPNYARYGRAAPLKRNENIIDAADFVLIFWDGHSKGTAHIIRLCQRKNKPHRIITQ